MDSTKSTTNMSNPENSSNHQHASSGTTDLFDSSLFTLPTKFNGSSMHYVQPKFAHYLDGTIMTKHFVKLYKGKKLFNLFEELDKKNIGLYREENGRAIVFGDTILQQTPSRETCRFVKKFFTDLHIHVSDFCDNDNDRKVLIWGPKNSSWNKHQVEGGVIASLKEKYGDIFKKYMANKLIQ